MSELRRKGPRIGQRHILVVCSGFGLGVLFSTRMSLPVALVSMISANTSSSDQLKSNSSCPTLSVNSTNYEMATTSVQKFNWDSHTRGLILSSFFWGYLTLQIPAGGLAQKYGAKWLIALSIGWLSLLTFLTPTMAYISPYALIALLALQGVGSSITIPSLFAMFGRWFPPEENSSLVAIVFSGAYFGIVYGEISAGLLCKSTYLGGWPMVFYVNGSLSVLFILIWTFLISHSPEDHPWITNEEKNYIISSVDSKQSNDNKRGIPWCRLLCSRSLFSFAIPSFIFGWFTYSYTTCFAQYISDILHQNVAATGGLLCLPLIADILMSNVFTRLVDLLRNRRLLSLTAARKIFTVLGFGSAGVFLFGITFIKCNLIQIEMCFILSFALFSAIYAGYVNTPLDNCPEYSGTLFGIGNVFANLSGLLAPIVIAKMTADGSRRSWNNVLYLNSGMVVFAAVFYVLIGNSERMRFESIDVTENEEEQPLLGSVTVN